MKRKFVLLCVVTLFLCIYGQYEIQREESGDRLNGPGELDCSLHNALKLGSTTCYCGPQSAYYTNQNGITQCWKGSGAAELGCTMYINGAGPLKDIQTLGFTFQAIYLDSAKFHCTPEFQDIMYWVNDTWIKLPKPERDIFAPLSKGKVLADGTPKTIKGIFIPDFDTATQEYFAGKLIRFDWKLCETTSCIMFKFPGTEPWFPHTIRTTTTTSTTTTTTPPTTTTEPPTTTTRPPTTTTTPPTTTTEPPTTTSKPPTTTTTPPTTTTEPPTTTTKPPTTTPTPPTTTTEPPTSTTKPPTTTTTPPTTTTEPPTTTPKVSTTNSTGSNVTAATAASSTGDDDDDNLLVKVLVPFAIVFFIIIVAVVVYLYWKDRNASYKPNSPRVPREKSIYVSSGSVLPQPTVKKGYVDLDDENFIDITDQSPKHMNVKDPKASM